VELITSMVFRIQQYNLFDNKWREFMLRGQNGNCSPSARKEEFENSRVMTK